MILTGEKDPIATIKNANLVSQKLGDRCRSHVIVADTLHNLIWKNI